MANTQKGFAKASMNDIVRASGLSKGGVYWHFKSKEELVMAIFGQFFIEQLGLLNGVLVWAISPGLVNLKTQVETAVQLLLQGLQST